MQVPEPQQLAARFKTKEIADDFKRAFDEARDAESEQQKTPTKTPQQHKTPSKAPSSELEVTWELKATADDIDRARAFQLPDTFYLPPRSRCPGCKGCEDDNDVTGADDDDDDVVFIKEVLPPTPLKKLAEQYQLPPYFYNQRNPDCKGCVGCLNDDDFHDSAPLEGSVTIDGTNKTPAKATPKEDKTMTSSPHPPVGTLPIRPDSPEVVFVREVLPATPLKERAEQYMLPPSFYNVRYGKCAGCPGCQDDVDYHHDTEQQSALQNEHQSLDEVRDGRYPTNDSVGWSFSFTVMFCPILR